MTREHFEFLLKVPTTYLMSSAVSSEDFDFVVENCNKDINTIEFDENN